MVKDISLLTDLDLDPLLSEALLGGAEFLSTFLETLKVDSEASTPDPVTCHICDRQIQPWFFERHTSLCIVSHKAESEVQDSHDHLQEHKQLLANILDQMESNRYPIVVNDQTIENPDTSAHNVREGSQLTRKSNIRAIELALDFCDLAIDVSTPAIPEEDEGDVLGRIQSPDSQLRIHQLREWSVPPADGSTVSFVLQRTYELVDAKLNAINRLHNTIHYSETIRQETDSLVQDLIDYTTEVARLQAQNELAAENDSEDLPAFLLEEVQDTPVSPRKSRRSSREADIMEPVPKSLFREPFRELLDAGQSPVGGSLKLAAQSPNRISMELAESLIEHESRAASPLSQYPPVFQNDLANRPHSGLIQPRTSLSAASNASSDGDLPTQVRSRKNSPLDLDVQLREVRISRGIYESPRRPSSGSKPPAGWSPSRRGSRALSRSRASSLARDRAISPGRKVLSARLNLIDKERLSPAASPTLSATDSTSTDTSLRDRRTSAAPPLSPRLPSIAPAARPAPPSIKDFEIIKPISKGAFGSVYLSRKRTTGDYFAIKVLKKADMIAKNQVTNVKAERAIMMAQTESPFIAKLFYTFQSKEYLYLVMEYLNGGDCAALIKQLGGLPEDWTRRYLAEVVLGLEFLHGRGIIHRDLKPDNLLISHNGHLKLTDFGLSRVGLVGRQNRARTASHPEAPDLLPASDFPSSRNTSTPSSRSTSFDFAQTGLSTPAIAPVSASDGKSHDYFHVRERAGSNDQPGSVRSISEALTSTMTNLTLDDKDPSEDGFSLDTPERARCSVTSTTSTQQMPPPAMKLFDPRDGHRRFVGTPDYLAPETINGSGQDDMVDWWSLGVVLFEFLYGYPPFHASTPDAVFENILNRKIDWPSAAEEIELGISDHAKDLVDRLMAMQPGDRLGAQHGAADIKAHPFFDGVVWDKISEEEALFIPTPDHPEDTEYFDSRGATEHVFDDDSDASGSLGPSSGSQEREPASISRESSGSSKMFAQSKHIVKRSMMPLSIPPHVRERRHHSRRLSESGKDEFGSFTFKNLGVLEKQNLETLKRLRSQASASSPVVIPRENHQRSASSSSSSYVRRSTSSASTLSSSTPISPTNAPTTRPFAPSSPLTSSQSTLPHRLRTATAPDIASGRPAELLSPSSPSKSRSLPGPHTVPPSPRNRAFTMGSQPRPEIQFSWTPQKQRAKVFEAETPSSSSDTEVSSGVQALRRVQRRRHRSQRLSSISLASASDSCRKYRALDIMICEDNPVSRRVLEAMLNKLKCRVVSVVDGAQAVAAATGDVVFDIIFTDIKLPRLSGVEVARLIRSSSGCNAATPIAAMSSYSTADLPEMSHFEKRLEKPLTLAAVSDTIYELVSDWEPAITKKRLD